MAEINFNNNQVPELNIGDLNTPNQVPDAEFNRAMRDIAKVPETISTQELSEQFDHRDEFEIQKAVEDNLVNGRMDADTAYKIMNAGTIAGTVDTLTKEKATLTRAAAEELASIKVLEDDTYRINTALNRGNDTDPTYLVARQLYGDWWLSEQRQKNQGGTVRKMVQRGLVPFVAGIGGTVISGAAATSSGGWLAGAGYAAGMSISEGGDAGWDRYMLGDTLHHVQENMRQAYVDIVYNYNDTTSETIRKLKQLEEYIDTNYPESYREEIYQGMEEGPSTYSGFGNFFAGAALVSMGKVAKGTTQLGMGVIRATTPNFVKRAVNIHIPEKWRSKEYVAENMDLDKDLEKQVNNYYQEKDTTGTSKSVANAKIEEEAPVGTSEEIKNVAKGIEKNLQDDATDAKANSDTVTELHVVFKKRNNNSTDSEYIERATTLANVSNNLPDNFVISEADIAEEANRVTFVHKRGTGHAMTSDEADKLVVKLYEDDAKYQDKTLVSTASPVEFEQAQHIRKSNEGSEMVAAGNYFSVEGEKFAPASKNYYTGKALRTNMRKILDENSEEYFNSIESLLEDLVESEHELKLKNVKGFAEGYQRVQLNLANLIVKRIRDGENLAFLKQMLRDYNTIATSFLHETSINLLHDPDYLEKATKRFGDSFTKASIEDKKAYLLHIALEEDYKGIQETVAKAATADVLLKHSDELKTTLNHTTIPSGRELAGYPNNYLFLDEEANEYKASRATEIFPEDTEKLVTRATYSSNNKLEELYMDLLEKNIEKDKILTPDEKVIKNKFLENMMNKIPVSKRWHKIYGTFTSNYISDHMKEISKAVDNNPRNISKSYDYIKKLDSDISLAFKDWATEKGIYGAFHSDLNVVMYDTSKIDKTLMQEIWKPDSYVQNVLDNGYAKMYDSDENGYVILESKVLDSSRPWQPFTAGVGVDFKKKDGRWTTFERWFYDYNAEGLKK